MEQKSPLENLFDQMSELLKLVNDSTGQEIHEEKIPLDIDERMSKLEKDVDAFVKKGEDIVAASGLSPEELRKFLNKPPEELHPDSRDLLDKAKQLQKQVEVLEASLKGTPSWNPPEKVPEDPKYGKHRRKKFKRFGGNDKWKPL